MPARPLHTSAASISLLLQELFPLCRSLTGPGNRETLAHLQRHIPLTVHEYPSGTPVYDWTIPREWKPRAGQVKGPDGRVLIDFAENNLHLVGCSVPVAGLFTLEELRPHLHWLDTAPHAIPYRTSYYKEDWGFCLSRNQFDERFAPYGPDAQFSVTIDAALEPGSLSVGELLIPGETPHEVLLSTYFCHPSLANDNLSGVVLTAFLAKELLARKNKYSYRIVFVPETIGAVAYCAHNEAAMQALDCGFVITCVAGRGPWGFKGSIHGEHRINRVVETVLREYEQPALRYPFDPHGSDERQYSSPGFRINTASITKDKYYEYPEYHTSLDTLDFISPEHLCTTLGMHLRALELLEQDEFYENVNPQCETMLSPRGLYPSAGGGMMPGTNTDAQLDAILWLLMLCDGATALPEVARQANLALPELRDMAVFLEGKGLLRKRAYPQVRKNNALAAGHYEHK